MGVCPLASSAFEFDWQEERILWDRGIPDMCMNCVEHALGMKTKHGTTETRELTVPLESDEIDTDRWHCIGLKAIKGSVGRVLVEETGYSFDDDSEPMAQWDTRTEVPFECQEQN